MVVSTVIAIIFLVTLLTLLYVKLTCGVCKSSKHLVGRVVIVTGANAGIGYETAKDLAERGARVILGCRSEQRGTEARDKIIAQTGNKDVHFKKLDLASLKSVRDFADDVIQNEQRLDILINNAAMFGSENVKTEDGILLGMQANHFAPFLLTCLLLPLLKSSAPSRIINVSSSAHTGAKFDLENLNMEKETDKTFDIKQVYFKSKLCNILMTTELARRLKGTGVTANAVHPGMVHTGVWNDIPVAMYFTEILRFFFKSPWEGAQTLIYLAVSSEVDNVSGYYYADCSQTPASNLAKNPELARKLWEISEKTVGLN